MDGDESDDEEEGPHKPEEKHAKGKDTKLAAAALCIGTGSFSDPDDIPGLAHFLEHMVFMGSEKYPDENSFDAFIKKHGGNSNAFTDCERTVFVFDVRRKHFREALDRFAQFFICPLLKSGSIEREIKAVESEYRMSYQNDQVKKMQLLQSLARDGHPYRKFLWGSESTLQTTPEEKGIDVCGQLKKFMTKMYSSQYMTLAVCSKEPLDTLELWVEKLFSTVPNNYLFFSKLPFEDSKFNKLYKVVPVRDIHQLEITWTLPCQQQHYRIKPLHYISWLLGHEGPGSVLSLLIKKYCWFEKNTNYIGFPTGLFLGTFNNSSKFQIATIVFQYLEMLRRLGPQKRIYDELHAIEENEFRFQEQCDPYEFVENVVENMQLFPEEDYLTGDQLMWEFNEEVISNAANLLTPEKANIMLSSQTYKEECTDTEPWFQTPFNCSELDPKWVEIWQNLDLNDELHLPAKNEYIATDFTIKDPSDSPIKFPVTVQESPCGRVWHYKDEKFRTPRSRYYFHFISSIVNESSQSMVLTEVFLKVLEYNLREVAYAAGVAQLSYSMSVHETGIVLRLSGFNHKLPLLFQTIVDYFTNFTVDFQTFDMVKRELMRTYSNTAIKPNKLIRSVRLAILQHIKWTTVDKRAAIPDITMETLESFVRMFQSKLYIESLIQGNVTSEEAIALQEVIYRKYLCYNVLIGSLSGVVQIRVVQLPRGECICRIPGMNKEDSNSVVIHYYQYGAATVEDFARLELLMMMMEEPCFDILRTREQLGYSVSCTCRNTFGVLGFSVSVQTQAEKFSVEHVASRINAFIDEFREILEKTSEEDFKSQVDSLIEIKRHDDLCLADEADRNWYEVLDQTYLFDRRTKEVEALSKVTKSELLNCFVSYVSGGDHYSKLSVQIVGSGESENTLPSPDSTMEVDNGLGEKEEWVLRPVPVEGKDFISITNIEEFKRSRPIFPVLKIT
ncbi:predicted protein [Nematostella vectensis]|uniref:Nardilysin n=1 Tax=Nematostella vectensis TaxID=45351 RepID=A7SXQ6_NEMVE|nr:predicted protein [Nematostella vectensis]|eukprot:XP_001623609.1 predicted protein [Nematostella vectensis]